MTVYGNAIMHHGFCIKQYNSRICCAS